MFDLDNIKWILGFGTSFLVPTWSTDLILREGMGSIGLYDTTSELGGCSSENPAGTTVLSSIGGCLTSTTDSGGEVVAIIFRSDNVAYDNIDRRADNIYKITHFSNRENTLHRPSIVIRNKELYKKMSNQFFDNKYDINLDKLYAIKKVLEKRKND